MLLLGCTISADIDGVGCSCVFVPEKGEEEDEDSVDTAGLCCVRDVGEPWVRTVSASAGAAFFENIEAVERKDEDLNGALGV